MAFYDFYRQNRMGVNPPQALFQPQPSWGGYDYYRAQAQAADSSLYEYGLERSRESNFAQGVGFGAGIEEAKIQHRRAYFGEMKVMMPADIGAAAAYEAWRNWNAYQGVYMQPLSADRERQQEALVGMAIGEAARLWNYTSNPMDTQGRLVAVEGAAATASKIFMQTAGGLGYQGGANGFGMGGSPLMGGAGAGFGVGGPGGLSSGLGIGAGATGMGAGNYLGVPQQQSMRRRSVDLGMFGGAGYGNGMSPGIGNEMGYGGGVGGGVGYGDGLGGGIGYGAGYGGGMPYGSGGSGYGSMAGSAGYGGAGMLSGGAGYGMGGTGLSGSQSTATHPFASSTGLLAGELEGRHQRRRSRSGSRRHRRRRSIDSGSQGAEFAQGTGAYGGYEGGGYGGYGGYQGSRGYGQNSGALSSGFSQGYAASR